MCTAVSCFSSDSYFGRNLDYEYSFDENVIIIPRNFIFKFKEQKQLPEHYAIIGVGIKQENYPLMFDCMNEYGLAFAGLNFPHNAVYNDYKSDSLNLAPYELPLWILAKYKTVREIIPVLEDVNLLNIPFSSKYPLTPLHFTFADKKEMIVFEVTENGNEIYCNELNTLTNNPVFSVMSEEMNKYIGLSVRNPVYSENDIYESNGLGGLGLPGDYSSRSRFVRAVFNNKNMKKYCNNSYDVVQFFHLLNSVYQLEGCVETKNGGLSKTIYSSCMNLNTGDLYYTTYENTQIKCLSLYRENLDSEELKVYPLIKTPCFLYGN